MWFLQSLLDDFQGHNIDTAVALVESAGRFLVLLQETHQRMENMLEVFRLPSLPEERPCFHVHLAYRLLIRRVNVRHPIAHRQCMAGDDEAEKHAQLGRKAKLGS